MAMVERGGALRRPRSRAGAGDGALAQALDGGGMERVSCS